ncbi:conjugative transposon protein TraM [Antarcticibacterium sp. 1MA-6-2]|uniref:conjugative transposon protein TraM n=1 Tax=Antarcticibacterium sp. 1MA-6-2 TaxID=2908210 RepID=UPI001F39E7F3|nr:conjugative transposon protein TraM [Antarcticibacterium sp. 1MA-6-2]UJH92717.1 conjugative transposon protein TraM [Antarcticibacterium sp. 1MA-6-2]
MKIDKKKIVFGAVLATIVLFIVAYSVLIFGEVSEEPSELKNTLVPELQQEQEDFKSKLDALNALKEVRETTTPSIYDEKYLDSMGYYDPDFPQREKGRILDSIYEHNPNNYEDYGFENEFYEEEWDTQFEADIQEVPDPSQASPKPQEMGLAHQLFYASTFPVEEETTKTHHTDISIMVEVDGNQVVQAGYRLKMRLKHSTMINNIQFPANTPVYGFISFQPNRALIEIEHIAHYPVKLKAYDLQDGSEGIYVENNIRADASKEVIGDIIQDINVAGVPQVGGLKQLFQRNNRNIKVQVTNNYKLILKRN